MIEIDEQPTTNPLDVPTPKPSEIVRNWPGKMWGKTYPKRRQWDGSVKFCSIGMIAETHGYAWGGETNWDLATVYDWFMERFAVTHEQVKQIYRLNDGKGKEAAADYLESLGL